MGYLIAFVLLAFGAILPILIAYGRDLDDWTMIRFWLWMMVPVIGWFMAMSIAMDSPRPAD